MKKIVISLMLAVLVLSTCLFSVSAAGNGSLSATSASGYRGDTVTVNVNLGSNPGLITMKFQVSYSSNLTLLSVSNSNLLGGWTTPAPDIQSPYTLRWADSLSTVNNTATGTLVTLTFKINDNAAIGTETVSITFNESLDANGGKNTFNSTSASITVKCRHDYGSWTKLDNNRHGKTCSICNDVQKENHGWDKGTETKTPSCKEEGEKTYSCSVCNGTKVEPIEKTDNHSYGAWSKADETSHSKTCSICNNVVTEVHDWDKGTQTKAPSCKEEGEMLYNCAACGDTKTEVVDKTDDHKCSNWVKTDDYEHSGTCSICQRTVIESHVWNNGVETKKATCKETGVMTYTCTAAGCGATHTEVIPLSDDHKLSNLSAPNEWVHMGTCVICQQVVMEDHSYDNGVVTKKATCKETGTKTYTCHICKLYVTTTIEKTRSHVFDSLCDTECNVCGAYQEPCHTFNVVSQSYVKDENYHWMECGLCGAVDQKLAHVPGPTATETEPQVCLHCGYVITPVPNHIHDYGENWVIEGNMHWLTCPGCEEKGSYGEHVFDAVCDEECSVCGYQRETEHTLVEKISVDEKCHWYECSVCGYKSDDALGHSFSEAWNSDEESHWRNCACGAKGDLAEHTYEDGICSVCGAEEPKSFVIWIVVGAVAVVAAAAVVVIVIKKKKS